MFSTNDQNILIYSSSTGLGTISIGSIIFFVGTGEKGFKTQELRLIGPVLASMQIYIKDE